MHHYYMMYHNIIKLPESAAQDVESDPTQKTSAAI